MKTKEPSIQELLAFDPRLEPKTKKKMQSKPIKEIGMQQLQHIFQAS
ncbi:MAG: hypothetical protein J4215_06150 [Candidatus Diapherotrites archaeon]|uniref:Uncharacterized protein n=1 Tax=Candidatus Iainarchaeum sp. TaxID=3101447 RepID=A0A8T4L477_9ARCH|nr:hypothetical protein [Candidatus Diapherotrites archaeon]